MAIDMTRSAGGQADVLGENPWVRRLLIGLVLAFLALFLAAPLLVIMVEALARGIGAFWLSLSDPDVLAAIRMTLLVAVLVLPVNALIGLSAAWAIAKYQFKGKSLLLSLIDLPFSVSPVIAGLVYVLLFGAQGLMGPWLQAHQITLVFALPAIVLATLFVTFPFVARELVPHMQALGNGDEEAALTLGASGWKTFLAVTLPNIKWSLLYGLLLCNARAMGEFGAVAVVSGKIRGLTVTMPLAVEILYNEYMSVAAFSVAAVLAGLALVTLVVKSFLEWRYADDLAAHHRQTRAVGPRH